VQSNEPIPPSRLRPRVPRDLETICLTCLQKEPHKRYGSAQELAQDLRRFMEGVSIKARPASRVERLWRWCRRKPALAAASAVALLTTLATVAALAVALSFSERSRDAVAQHAKAMEDKANVEFSRRRDAELNESRSAFEDSFGKCRPEEASRGLLSLARSLRVAIKNDAPDVEESIRAQLHGWSRYVHPLRAMLPHEESVTALAFSPEGKLILTGSHDGTARLWDAKTGEPLCSPLKHQDRISAIAFSPDSQTILVGTRDGETRLWKTATGHEVCPPLKRWDVVTAVAFSPDGKWAVTASGRNRVGQVRLWDAATGQPVGQPLEQQQCVNSLAFSPDGKWLLVGSEGRDDDTARLWDMNEMKPVGPSMKSFSRAIVAFSPNGKRFLTTPAGGIQLWDTITREPIKPSPDKAGVYAVAFSRDSKKLLTGHEFHNAAFLWDVETGKAIGSPMRHQMQVMAVAFSPDGKTVLTGSADRTARLWDAETGLPTGPPLHHQAAVTNVAFGPDGKTVVTGADDTAARLWEVAGGKTVGRPLVHGTGVGHVAFSPDGQSALTRVAMAILVWDVPARKLLGVPFGSLPKSPENPRTNNFAISAAFAPDSQSILVSYQGFVRRWEARTGKALGPLLPLARPDAWIIAFHRDGNTVLLRYEEKKKGIVVQPWDLAADKALGPPIPLEQLFPVALSPNGELLLTGEGWTLEGKKRSGALLREVRSGKEVARFPHQDAVTAVAFSPDGHTFLTGSVDYTARLWDVKTGKPLGPPLQHQDKVSAVAFSSDGKTVLTGSWDRTARLWEVKTGKPIGPPLRHRGLVISLAFSPDGKLLLTGDMDSTKSDWEGAQFWEGPAAVAGDSDRIRLWVEVITGLELDEHGAVQVLDAAAWQQRRQLLEKHGSQQDSAGSP
jgi:WD40 repeat protein